MEGRRFGISALLLIALLALMPAACGRHEAPAPAPVVLNTGSVGR
jgi:hypothetical protein